MPEASFEVQDRAPAELFTPVNLLTGFLGSGKTTLLQRLLADPAFGDTAVLINEFGEVGLDHHLLERIDDTMVLLQSGCLCCTIRGELSESLRDLHVRRAQGAVPSFRRVVVESTGLADPFPILSTIHADNVLRHHYRVGNVIATIDAVNAATQLRTRPECVRQIAVADRLVLTKTDLADPGSLMADIAAICRTTCSSWREKARRPGDGLRRRLMRRPTRTTTTATGTAPSGPLP